MHLRVRYNPTEEIQLLLTTLDAQRYSISALVPPGLEVLFQERAQYVNAHSSSVIEGNQLALDEAIAVMSGEGAARGKDEVQVAQLNEAYGHAYRISSDPATRVDEGTIRALNSVLQKGSQELGARSRGAYRPGMVVIRDAAAIAPIYIPPPAEEVAGLMAELASQIGSWMETYPGPVAAALAHYALVSIHPFEDGNGRTARLLADMILDLSHWSFNRMLSVNEAILANRDEYIDTLRLTQGGQFTDEEHDVTPFVAFQLRQLRESADRLQAGAVSLNRMIDQTIADLDGERRSAQARRLPIAFVYLMLVGPISSSRYATLTRCSQATATSDLALLERSEVVTREGAGRSTRYRWVPRDRSREAATTV